LVIYSSFFWIFEQPQYDLGEYVYGKKTIVLDLDETLIHSCSKEPAHYDHLINFRDNGQSYRMYIQKRPGVDTFLKELSKMFEICIFTASTKEYADPIIDKLSISIPHSHRFYRNHCTIKSGMYIKDLSRFNRPISSILLIDNSPVSVKFQPENGIICKTWTGGRNDRELTSRLLPTLFWVFIIINWKALVVICSCQSLDMDVNHLIIAWICRIMS